MCLCVCARMCIWLNHSRVNCGNHSTWPLNISAVFPDNKCSLLHNLKAIITFEKINNYLIILLYHPHSYFSNCPFLACLQQVDSRWFLGEMTGDSLWVSPLVRVLGAPSDPPCSVWAWRRTSRGLGQQSSSLLQGFRHRDEEEREGERGKVGGGLVNNGSQWHFQACSRACGPQHSHIPTCLRCWTRKANRKRAPNSSLQWYAKDMEVQVLVLPLACWLVILD